MSFAARSRVDRKRMYAPSLVHPSGVSRAGWLEMLCGFDPSAPITYTSSFPSRLLQNAIVEPSGDHDGTPECPCGVVVSCVSPVPSTFITHTSLRPARDAANAIRFPSGDHAGAAP